MNVNAVLHFTKVMFQWAQNGGQFVAPKEAERRARICLACPKNQKIGPCRACSSLPVWIVRVLGGRKLKVDPGLQVCAVCHCANKASVWIPMEAKRTVITKEMRAEFPDFCWQN